MKPLRIYVAGAYSADSEGKILQNVQKAIDVGLILFKLGHFPYIPHITYMVDKRANELNIKMTWENYMDYHIKWLEVSDALFLVSHSKGADIELEFAKKHGKQIFYSLNEIPNLIVEVK